MRVELATEITRSDVDLGKVSGTGDLAACDSGSSKYQAQIERAGNSLRVMRRDEVVSLHPWMLSASMVCYLTIWLERHTE